MARRLVAVVPVPKPISQMTDAERRGLTDAAYDHVRDALLDGGVEPPEPSPSGGASASLPASAK